MKFPLLFLILFSASANAQWSVYDDEVFNQVRKINQVAKLEIEQTNLEKTFKSTLNTDANNPQDLSIGEGTNKAILKGIDTKFEALTDLTPEDQSKYIGTAADCGSKTASPQIYNSCLGLRNLRIQTLKTTQQSLRNLWERRKQIAGLVNRSREVSEQKAASGEMQRYHFELQSLQALMAADSEMVRMVMGGYKDREKLYEIQQAEAQRDMLARGARTDKQGNAITSKPLPFLSPMRALYRPSEN